MANILYRKQKQQKSLDNGATWVDTGEYRVGAILENPSNCQSEDSKQCRWVELDASEGYYCDTTTFTKYTVQVEECTENGIIWTRTGNQKRGNSVIETQSNDCGYIKLGEGFMDCGNSYIFIGYYNNYNYIIMEDESNTYYNKMLEIDINLNVNTYTIPKGDVLMMAQNILKDIHYIMDDSKNIFIRSNALEGFYWFNLLNKNYGIVFPYSDNKYENIIYRCDGVNKLTVKDNDNNFYIFNNNIFTPSSYNVDPPYKNGYKFDGCSDTILDSNGYSTGYNFKCKMYNDDEIFINDEGNTAYVYDGDFINLNWARDVIPITKPFYNGNNYSLLPSSSGDILKYYIDENGVRTMVKIPIADSLDFGIDNDVNDYDYINFYYEVLDENNIISNKFYHGHGSESIIFDNGIVYYGCYYNISCNDEIESYYPEMVTERYSFFKPCNGDCLFAAPTNEVISNAYTIADFTNETYTRYKFNGKYKIIDGNAYELLDKYDYNSLNTTTENNITYDNRTGVCNSDIKYVFTDSPVIVHYPNGVSNVKTSSGYYPVINDVCYSGSGYSSSEETIINYYIPNKTTIYFDDIVESGFDWIELPSYINSINCYTYIRSCNKIIAKCETPLSLSGIWDYLSESGIIYVPTGKIDTYRIRWNIPTTWEIIELSE